MNASFDRQCRERLPAAVYDLAMRLGVSPDDEGRNVMLTQTGRMKRRLGDPAWLAFTATQTISTRASEFDWRARFGPLGMIAVRDALQDGEGRLDITALGVLPMARTAHTPELLRGELMRYLAELAWAPAAILANTTLRWREIDPDTLSVSAGSGEAAAEVFLSLDGDGRIAGAYAPDRPRSIAATYVPTPWRGRYSDYRLHQGCWIPFAGEVAWDFAGKPDVYWQGSITTWTCA